MSLDKQIYPSLDKPYTFKNIMNILDSLNKPHKDCVLCLRFNGNAQDYSEYKNHGTIHGASWTNGKYGKALSFDGVDDYVEVSDIDITEKITISLWVKKGDISDKTNPRLVEKNVMTAWTLYVNNTTNKPIFAAQIGGVNKSIEGSALDTN